MGNGLHSEIVTDLAGLVALVPEWWRLWSRLPSPLPFQSPAWLVPWWRTFAPGALCVTAVRDAGGTLAGLAPFYIEEGEAGRRLLPLGISLSDHLDVLADPAREHDVLHEMVECALSCAARWDEWCLEEAAPDAAALRLAAPAGWSDRIGRASPCPVLALSDADRCDPVPKKRRQALRTARNRARRRGDVAIGRTAANGLPDAFDSLVRLHARRWHARGEPGVLACERVRSFHSAALPLLHAAGLANLYVLTIGGRTTAVHYELVAGNRRFYYLGGFDPDLSFESPGALLLGHAVDEAIREGASEMDLLRGREAYKQSWGARERWNMRRSLSRIAAG